MPSNYFKALFLTFFLNAPIYAIDSFDIDEKTSLFSAKHGTVPVITAQYVGWKAEWEWTHTNITPTYNPQQASYLGSIFNGHVNDLGIDFTGDVAVSENKIDWTYSWDKQSNIADAIGYGIDFRLDRSLDFIQGAADPEILPDNKGWRWQTPTGQTIEVTFSPAIASVSLTPGKSIVRALFFTDISQGTQQTVMTVKTTQNVSINGPVVLDYDDSDTSLWHKDLLPKDKSPIDLSFLNNNEKPAGTQGFVRANGEKLFFEETGNPAKFWGTNVQAFALLSSSDEDIKIHTKRIAEYGYNLVRIHHHDSHWVTPNIFTNPTDNTLELSADSFKKIDLWIKLLKEEGIYIWLDLHVGRYVTNNDDIDHFDDFAKGNSRSGIKGFNYYNETIQSAMQAFNEDYLNHINEFTGKSYKEDEAVIAMLITNENDLTQHFGNSLLEDKNVPIHHEIFSEDIKQFAQFSGLSEDKMGRTWQMGESKIYLSDVEHRFNQKMMNHLDSLGVESLIATTNSWGGMGLFGLPSLTDGDIVDAHSYGRAEEFKYNPRFNPGFLAWAGAAQVSGKPFSFTEWNIEPFPARDRFVAPVFTASIANLQGWDAIMQYGYGQDSHWGTRGTNYSSNNDPGLMALMPAAAILFRQNHVAPANNSYELKLSRDDFFFIRQDPRSSKSVRTLLETSRFTIGMPDTPELPWLIDNTLASNADFIINDANQDFIPVGQDFVESDTQELKRNWVTGVQTVNTAKSQIASGWIGGKSINLDDVSFNIDTNKAVVAVQSLENKPISESNEIFISIVARSEPSNGINMIPFLSEPVTGQISIVAPEGLKLYPVNNKALLEKEIGINRNADGKYIINLTSEMKTHWFKLQNKSIPFRINSPTEGSIFPFSAPVTITTNGADLGDEITHVQFFNEDEELLGTANSSPYQYTANNLPTGNHVITARITFNDGMTESKRVSVMVGDAPFVITSPSDGAVFSKDEPIIITTNAATFNKEIHNVHFWIDNYQWVGAKNTPPFELSLSNVSVGEHDLRSRVFFKDGSPHKDAILKTIIVEEEGVATPPVISNVLVTTTDTTATITWTTDVLSNSTVNYGLDNNYGTSESASNLVTLHSVSITGLTANTEYHFQVSSENTSGNVSDGSDQMFTTDSNNNNEVIYEDGQDNLTDRWVIYDSSPEGALISNVNDNDKASQVISFQGAGGLNGYMLGNNAGRPRAWNNTSHKIIHWDMKINQGYAIYIALDTTLGQRYLTYTRANTNAGLDRNYVLYGLGAETANGQWQSFTRDLEADLEAFEAGNEIISVNGFLIRGNARIDNIKLSSVSENVDTTAPSVPTGLKAENVSINSVSLSWNPSVDSQGTIARYHITRNNNLLDTTTELSFVDDTVAENTSYSYSVTAEDNSGNISPSSVSLLVDTPQDTSNLNEVIYEDGQDNSTDRWVIYDASPDGASISNVNDNDKASQVISFQGAGGLNGYMLGNNAGRPRAWNNASHKIIHWDMKINQGYAIYIALDTTLGQRYLTYTRANTNAGLDRNYVLYGLGGETSNGQWQSFSRNLEADLEAFEAGNEIISVNGFLIRGNARVDNIKLTSNAVE